jgi:hypothetical protein
MDHLHLPTVDFFFAPKVEPMFRGVDYIRNHVAAGALRLRSRHHMPRTIPIASSPRAP